MENVSTTSTALTASQMTDRFFTMVKSLDEFDQKEVRGIINTLISPTDREQCFIANYRRAYANVGTLLEMKSPKHFQAVAMLARGLFELAVDIRLLDVVSNGCEKMIAFVDVEKLRCARKILRFKAANPSIKPDTSIYDSFITANETRIDALRKSLWPPKSKVDHWSDMNLRDRVTKLGAPFTEIYDFEYPRLSWYVHSGLTGVVNLKAETFTLLCGQAFKLAVDSYWEVLSAIIREFKLSKAVEKIEGKMKLAKVLPFTDTPEQAEQLLQELTGGS